MSLSARIAIDPSRCVAFAGVLVPIGGVVAALAASAARWPAFIGLSGVIAFVVSAAIVANAACSGSRACRRVLVVSNRSEFDVVADPPCGLETSWRLVDATVAWPGFAMLAMRQDEGRAVVYLSVATATLGVHDRRALDRFLLWSLRGGAAVAPVSGVR